MASDDPNAQGRPPSNTGPSAKSRRTKGIVVFGVLGVCLALVGFYLLRRPVTRSLSLSSRITTHVAGRGDLLLAVKSIEVNGAQVRLKPGSFQVPVGGHVIDVQPESDLTIDIHKLILQVTEAAAPPNGKAADPAADSSRRVTVELQEADLATTGQLLVAVDGRPGVRVGDIRVSSTPNEKAVVSAEMLFGTLIAALVADVMHAPVAQSKVATGDVQMCLQSASVKSAVLSLRPGALVCLAGGNEITLGEPSQLSIRDLEYDNSRAECWKAKADLDLAWTPPAVFIINQLVFQPGAGRARLALDVSMNDDQLTVELTGPPAQFGLAGGVFHNKAPAWEGDLKKADVSVQTLKYLPSRAAEPSELTFSGSLSAHAQVRGFSDQLAISGAEASIQSLTFRYGDHGKLKGVVSFALALPKSELIKVFQAELAKPHVVKGGNLGKVLGLDCSVSDLQVDTKALKASFAGPAVIIQGPLSVSGKLTTQAKILGQPVVNHNDFTLGAKLTANAAARFPPATELAKQAIELKVEYHQATLTLGGFAGKMPLADDLFQEALKKFGIDRKIKEALPSEFRVDLFKNAKGETSAFLSMVRNPQIKLSDDKELLVVTGTADIEF